MTAVGAVEKFEVLFASSTHEKQRGVFAGTMADDRDETVEKLEVLFASSTHEKQRGAFAGTMADDRDETVEKLEVLFAYFFFQEKVGSAVCRLMYRSSSGYSPA